jgi:hypothetical protein
MRLGKMLEEHEVLRRPAPPCIGVQDAHFFLPAFFAFAGAGFFGLRLLLLRCRLELLQVDAEDLAGVGNVRRTCRRTLPPVALSYAITSTTRPRRSVSFIFIAFWNSVAAASTSARPPRRDAAMSCRRRSRFRMRLGDERQSLRRRLPSRPRRRSSGSPRSPRAADAACARAPSAPSRTESFELRSRPGSFSLRTCASRIFFCTRSRAPARRSSRRRARQDRRRRVLAEQRLDASMCLSADPLIVVERVELRAVRWVLGVLVREELLRSAAVEHLLPASSSASFTLICQSASSLLR